MKEAEHTRVIRNVLSLTQKESKKQNIILQLFCQPCWLGAVEYNECISAGA